MGVTNCKRAAHDREKKKGLDKGGQGSISGCSAIEEEKRKRRQ
jgi:hypothetical protein